MDFLHSSPNNQSFIANIRRVVFHEYGTRFAQNPYNRKKGIREGNPKTKTILREGEHSNSLEERIRASKIRKRVACVRLKKERMMLSIDPTIINEKTLLY
jgi:hypothetical protein